MLDELRRKSPYVKQSYAFWGAVGVTSVVVIGWMASLPSRFGDLNTALEGEGRDQTAGVSEILDGIKGLKEEAGEVFKAATATSSSNGAVRSDRSIDPTRDPILIATSSKPADPAPKSIQIATSSTPNR